MENLLPARADELKAARARLECLDGGAGAVLLISGPAGAGKTTLMRTALGDAPEVRVLSGRAYRFQTPVAFGPVIEALGLSLRTNPQVEDLAADLHSLSWLFDGLPVAAPMPTDVSLQRPRLLHGLHTLIHRMATTGPMALTIDDAHWADDATIEFLALLLDSLSDVPLALLLTERSNDPDANPAARTLFNRIRRDGGTEVVLRPLDLAGVTEVAESELGGGRIQPGLLRLLHERTGGTPLFVIEALSQLRERGEIEQVGSIWQFAGTRIPKSAFGSDLMAGRLAGCSADELALLEMLALHGEPLAETDLATVGADTSRLGALARRRLILEQVDSGIPRWSLEHPVLADVIVDQLTTTDRQARHEQLARLFIATDLGRFAHHLVGAGPRAVRVAGSDRGVCTALFRAGELAERRRDLIEATDLLTSALDWMTVGRPNARAAAVTAALARVWSGRGHHATAQQLATQSLEEFLSLGDLDRALDVAETLSNAKFLGDALDVDWLDRLVGHLEQGGTDFQRLVARFRQYQSLSRLGLPCPKEDEPLRTIDALRQSSDELTARHAELILAVEDWGAPSDLLERQRAYLALRDEPDLIESCTATGWHGVIDMTMARGAWSESEELERAYLEWLASTDVPRTWRLAVFRWNRLIARGDLHAALHSEFDFRYAAARNPRVIALQTYQEILTHDAAGNRAALMDSDLVERIEALSDSSDRGARFLLDCAHLTRVALLGDVEAVVDATRPELRLFDGAPLASHLANALADLLLGDEVGLRRVTSSLRSLDPRRQDLPSALADRFTGEWARRTGDHESAALLLRRSHDWSMDHEHPIEATRTALLLETVEPVLSETLLALEARLRELDVKLRADELALLLRVRGVSVHRSDDGSYEPADRLSRREREVAELVMEGLTNRELADRLFISIRTVTSHLDHIYTKLGVSSRRDLAPILRGDTPAGC